MYILLFVLVLVFLLSGAFFETPWIPTRRKDFDRIADLAELRPGLLFYDLGSGSGEMLFYLSKKYNISCVGIEISPLLYLYSKIKSLFYRKVKINYGNFFKCDLSKADVIYVFLQPKIYEKVKNKVDGEAKNGAKTIIACWPLKDSNPVQISIEEGRLNYYSYMLCKKEGHP